MFIVGAKVYARKQRFGLAILPSIIRESKEL
jgi:hypothetical protein